jgi:hypothetical protein
MFTRQVRKQLAQNIERVSVKEKNPCQVDEWVFIVTRQAWILLAFGELASGYPHPCTTWLHKNIKLLLVRIPTMVKDS